jgi:hypothetical protein
VAGNEKKNLQVKTYTFGSFEAHRLQRGRKGFMSASGHSEMRHRGWRWCACLLLLAGDVRAAPPPTAFSRALPSSSLRGCVRSPRNALLGPMSRRAGRHVAVVAPQMLSGGADEAEMSEVGLGDLSVLGAFGKLRAGVPTKTRELPKPSRINESFEIQCEKASYLLKINRHCSAAQMFEGEAASQQVRPCR